MVALAIYGVRRYIANAKTSEAKNSVSAIARGAQAAFERKREMAQSESDASSGIDALCDSAEPVPTAVPAGTKYVSVGSDWSSDDSDRGWQCLRFVMASPQYYQYQYNRGGGYVGNDLKGKEGYEAAAIGDLDADGTTSLYATGAELRGSNLRPMTLLEIRDEFE
jgi:type IV pilus assembly protein PilA